MGQPVTVLAKESTRPGIVRLEVNRSLTGMAPERYAGTSDIVDDRPADVLAARLLEVDGVKSLHMNSNVVTIETDGTADAAQLQVVAEELFTYYRDGATPAPVAGSPRDS